MQRKQAFTLLELMVAMGIIAVLAAMSVFGVSIVQQSLRNTQRRSTLNDVDLAINAYFESNGSYPTNLVLQNDAIYVQDTSGTQVPLDGAAQPTSDTFVATEDAPSSGTFYCFEAIDGGGSYLIGVRLEGSTDWFTLGDSTISNPDSRCNNETNRLPIE